MAKKPVKATEEEMEAIEKGMAAAREYEESEKELEAEEVVEVLRGQRKPSPSRPVFDHTGVQPPVEPEMTEEQVEEKGVPGPVPVTITTLRDVTIGPTSYPKGANLSVPVGLAEVMISAGNAAVAIEQPRPEEPPPEESPDPVQEPDEDV